MDKIVDVRLPNVFVNFKNFFLDFQTDSDTSVLLIIFISVEGKQSFPLN